MYGVGVGCTNVCMACLVKTRNNSLASNPQVVAAVE